MIAIGSDHGGYDLKQVVIKYLEEQGIAYRDFGCYDKNSCDYPLFGKAAAEAVASGECEKGIVVCTTGIGISIAANKVAGVRCALCQDTFSAKMTRLHNNANMLALGGGIVGPNLALDIVETFLNTPFSEEEKHCRRIGLLE
ncbi:MAG: ribose 5-phosphate isomerase B [Lachnospiraceae bacterium]|nr:ribose 5-phosphate isomerase B [Lachnospiraceae bacterium]MBQ7781519.1 ribose 5-phosphate isomerase B [Lachnospiraceae bacterium]